VWFIEIAEKFKTSILTSFGAEVVALKFQLKVRQERHLPMSSGKVKYN